MENDNEANEGTKRIRLELKTGRKAVPSDSGDKRRERNLKYKDEKRKLRGRLDFYYNEENEKVELHNKMDKIKLKLGEGKFNRVSTFELLHRLCDFFINVNLPEPVNEPNLNENSDYEPMYQHCSLESARTDGIFIGCMSSVQKLASQVHAHDVNCSEKLQVMDSKKNHCVMSVDLKCDSDRVIGWTSSPHMSNGKFLASARLCHGFLSSGMLPNQFQKLCEASDLGEIGEIYMNNYIDSYKDIVENEAMISKERALEEEIAMSAALLPDDEQLTGINILTDARHCWRKNAKFSDVVCLGAATNKCIQVETITKEDDKCSQRHELLGVKRIYSYLDEKDCPVNLHAHDNNNSINKYVREERSPTQNATDTWHMTKGIAKAAKKITTGFKSSMGTVWHEELSDKAAAIKTHVFHSMKNCNNNADKLRSNILTFVDHYQGDHENCMSTSRCKTDECYESIKRLIKDEKAVVILTDFLKSIPVYKDAERYKYCMDTHYVESYNNALLQYVDKRICFGFNTYKLRINLSLLDWNENINREKTSDREMRYKRDPTKSYYIPVKKRKTINFKESIWNKWLDHLYM